MPRVSLRVQSVLYRNDPAALRRCVESLAHATRIARGADLVGAAVLALGDCAPDAPSLTASDVAALREAHADAFAVEHEVFEANLGHGGGHNRLAAGLDADALLVVNPDTVAEPLLVARLAARLGEPGVGIVEARQLPVEHPKHYELAGGATPWASMACSLLRREVVEQTGLFDADTFFMHCDDVDLSWRARLAGWHLAHQPEARVFHDKRVGVAGYVEPSSSEAVHGPLGHLLLAYKYSRDDEVQALSALLRDGTPEQKEALALYEQRVAQGRLPSPRLDPEGRVAQFSGGTFAPHRF